MRIPSWASLLVGVAGMLPFAAFSQAGGVEPGHDPCLVGTWVQGAGGAAEWMRKRMPQQQQLQMDMQQPNGVLVLQADGRYSANATQLGLDAIQKDPAGFRASLRAEASSSGRWSSGSKQLRLEADQATFTSSSEEVAQAAARLRDRQAARRGRVFYACAGNHMSTETEIRPGETFPTRYVRVRDHGR